jgi:hypothetical protein
MVTSSALHVGQILGRHVLHAAPTVLNPFPRCIHGHDSHRAIWSGKDLKQRMSLALYD